ncbi:hypothetical protein WL36_05025 [Burkholderia ubonensis]|nr:hypothetical protein WL36_05025 [Burkholderia ubonensis]
MPPGWTFSRATLGSCFDADGVMKVAPASAARFDHDPATREPRGILLEGGRTNFLLYSNAVEKWTPFDVTFSTDGALAPDGATLARVITETAGGSVVHAVSQNVALTVGKNNFTYANRLRKNGCSAAVLFLGNRNTTEYCRATFDLDTGEVTERSATGTWWRLVAATCVSLGGGWWECRLVGAVNSATEVRCSTYLANGRQIEYTGDGVSGI